MTDSAASVGLDRSAMSGGGASGECLSVPSLLVLHSEGGGRLTDEIGSRYFCWRGVGGVRPTLGVELPGNYREIPENSPVSRVFAPVRPLPR